MQVVAHGVEQVGLAEPDAAVDEQGVEPLSWILGGGLSGRGGELVAGTQDEVLEAIAVQDAAGNANRPCGRAEGSGPEVFRSPPSSPSPEASVST